MISYLLNPASKPFLKKCSNPASVILSIQRLADEVEAQKKDQKRAWSKLGKLLWRVDSTDPESKMFSQAKVSNLLETREADFLKNLLPLFSLL